MTPVLEVEGLSYSFDSERPALRGISFRVHEGECVGIVGANGAGKTTLLWCVLGLHKAQGSVRLFGEKFGKKSRQRVGVVFQNPEDQLFMPELVEDIALPLINRGVPREEAARIAMEALAGADLEGAASRSASQLSLGERKRAAIAAALAGQPELLLLDEPTAELDGRSVRHLTALLAEQKVARLIASHQLEFLGLLCSRVLVLSQGRIVADGEAARILGDVSLLESAGLI